MAKIEKPLAIENFEEVWDDSCYCYYGKMSFLTLLS